MGSLISKVVVAVPQQNSYVVQFFGKYYQTLEPGLNFLIPIAQRVAYKHSLKEESYMIKAQSAVTQDNVLIVIDGVLYLRQNDPYQCSYGAKDPLNYTYVLAQGIMRSEIGSLTLDQTFEERETMNGKILNNLKNATEDWGIECLRYEIRDIRVSQSMKKMMNLEAQSERIKRAEILISEGQQTSQINRAEAIKRTQILEAQGRAEEIILNSHAISQRILNIGQALETTDGMNAAQFEISSQYIKSLGGLSDSSKQILLNTNLSNPDEIIANSLKLIEKKQKSGNKD